jgi:hypothetical protein
MRTIAFTVIAASMLVLGGSGCLAGDKKPSTAFVKDELQSPANCLVYVYRLKSAVGGAVKWPVIRWDIDGKGHLQNKHAYCEMKQLTYVPLLLDAGKIYKIQVGGWECYFLGEPSSITILRFKGMHGTAASIQNSAFIKMKADTLLSWLPPTVWDTLADAAFASQGFTKLIPNSEAPEYKELQTMSLAEKIVP